MVLNANYKAGIDMVGLYRLFGWMCRGDECGLFLCRLWGFLVFVVILLFSHASFANHLRILQAQTTVMANTHLHFLLTIHSTHQM